MSFPFVLRRVWVQTGAYMSSCSTGRRVWSLFGGGDPSRSHSVLTSSQFSCAQSAVLFLFCVLWFAHFRLPILHRVALSSILVHFRSRCGPWVYICFSLGFSFGFLVTSVTTRLPSPSSLPFPGVSSLPPRVAFPAAASALVVPRSLVSMLSSLRFPHRGVCTIWPTCLILPE